MHPEQQTTCRYCPSLRDTSCDDAKMKDCRTVMAMMIIAYSGVTKIKLNLHCVL